MPTLYIGLDDTDIPTSPGTGHLAREVASVLAARFPVLGVTRHQLLSDPRVPMTAKNSANVIHLQTDFSPLNKTQTSPQLRQLAIDVAYLMQAHFQPGSDPGLCVAVDPPPLIAEFGYRAKTTLVTADEARALADARRLLLWALGGDGSGVIGALAAVGLAASGNDGRFIWVGHIRELRGLQPAEIIMAAGVAGVQTTQGQVVKSGLVETCDKLRPSLIGGQAVLLVEPANGHWRAVRRD